MKLSLPVVLFLSINFCFAHFTDAGETVAEISHTYNVKSEEHREVNNSLTASNTPTVVVYLSRGKRRSLSYVLSSPTDEPVPMNLIFLIADYPFRGRIIVRSLSGKGTTPLLVMDGGLARNFLEVNETQLLIKIEDFGHKKNSKAVIAFEYNLINVQGVEGGCGGNLTAIEEAVLIGVYPNKSQSGYGMECSFNIQGQRDHLVGIEGIMTSETESSSEFKVSSGGIGGTPVLQSQAAAVVTLLAVNATDVGVSYTDNAAEPEKRGFTFVFVLVKNPKTPKLRRPTEEDARKGKKWLRRRLYNSLNFFND